MARRRQNVELPLPLKYYDRAQREQIPNASWSTGDDPVAGRVHVDLYVTGSIYGADVPGLDEYVKFDRGYYEINDPDRGTNYVYGEHVSNKHDGHCSQTRWRLARFQDETSGHAYLGMLEAVVRTIWKAKERAAVEVTTPRGRTAVHKGSVGSGCAKGRHRSTNMANEGAEFARSLGATAQVHFMHLFRGAIPVTGDRAGIPDERGPCGCHLNSYMCQYLSNFGSHRSSQWNDIANRCDRESDEIFDRLSKPLRQTLQQENFTGRAEDHSTAVLSTNDRLARIRNPPSDPTSSSGAPPPEVPAERTGAACK
jgi:hypothetical protein